MRVLVTGGAGFIGLRIVKKLLERGHKPIIMSRNPKITEPELKEGVATVSGDMRLLSDVIKAVSASRAETIIHLAYALTAAGEADPYWAIEVNVLGSNNFFETARLLGLKRVIFCSSIAAYAPFEMYQGNMVHEDEPLLKAPSIYGQTKALNEFMAAKFEAKYGVEIPSVRISAVYGTGRATRGVTAWTSQMVAAAVSGQPVKIGLRPDKEANFIYVDDSAEQLVRLVLKDHLDHRIYNSGGICSTPEAFAAIVRRYFAQADIEFDLHAPQWPYPPKVDGSRLEQEIDFSVRRPEKGLWEQINMECKARGKEPVACLE
jgi:nucleoside-diphosphate-sugar epimerase